MIKKASNLKGKKGSELRGGESERMSPGALDEHYIAAFEANPLSKPLELLKKAIELAEVDLVATSQRAYEIKERLLPKLEARLLERAKNARTLGLNTLETLCADEKVSASVRAQVATTLTKDIFPNVTTVKKQSYDEMLNEAETLRKQRLDGEPATKH